MSVTRFESVVAAQTVGTADIDKLSASFEKLSGAIEGSGKHADKIAEHPGFESFAEKVKAGIENPLQAAGQAAEAALGALGPMGTAVAAGAGIFTAAGAATFEAARGLAEYGTQVHNVSLRTGLTTVEVGQFSFAAKAAGQGVEVFESAMRKLSQGLDDTSEEGKKARKGLGDLGVEAYGADGKLRPMSEIFVQISDGLKGIEDPAKRNTEVLRIFGRAGIELIPTMLQLSENIARAKDLGLGPSEENVARWESYHKQIAEAEVRWAALAREVKEPLAAIFTLTFRGATGDVSDIAGQAAAALKGEIGKIATDEAQRRLDLLKASDMVSPAVIQELQKAINLRADRMADNGLFTRPEDPNQWMAPRGLAVAGFEKAPRFTVDMKAFTGQVDEALGGSGSKGELEEAKKKLAALQDKLRADQELKAPITQQLTQAAEIQTQKDKIAGIEARTKATKDLEASEKSLAAFEQQMAQKDLGAVARLYAQAEALIAKEKLTGAMAERAMSAVRIPASEALAKEEDEQTKRNEKLSRELTKIAEEHGKEWETVYKDIGTAAQRSVDIWIKTGEQVSQLNVQGQIQRAGAASQQRIGFLGMAAAPGQEGLLANAEYVERLALAKQIYDLEKAQADRIQDSQAQRIAYARSFAQLKDAEYAAEVEHENKIAELQRRRVDQFRSEMGSVFDALQGGGKGIEQFVVNQARTIGRAVFSNIMTAEFKTHDALTRNTVFGGTWLADPTKDVAGTKLMGAGDHLHTAAGALQEAARVLATSRTGGVGGLAPAAAGGIGLFASGNPTDAEIAAAGITPEDMAALQKVPAWGPDMGSSIGPAGTGRGVRRGVGIAAAAVGGGFGIYSGIKSGGARGDLTAAGSAVAMLGAILPELSKTLAIAGPIGMIAGLGLGLVTTMLPDPKQLRDLQETERLNAARYTAPTASSYARDRFGRGFDYGVDGGIRITNNVYLPVSAIDSRDFMDRAPSIVQMLTGALEDKVSPRLMTAVRNTVRVG